MQRQGWFDWFREGDARLTNAALCVFGVALLWLARQFGMEEGRFWIGFENVALLSAMVFLGAVLLVRTQPVSRATLWIVVWFAVAMHVMTFLVDPFFVFGHVPLRMGRDGAAPWDQPVPVRAGRPGIKRAAGAEPGDL